MSARVLVVDDHLEMARLLADQLRDVGYEVDIAGGGTQAVDAARSRLPDLVIADLRMQEVDGLDVLREVKRLDPHLPVLIMTAFGGLDSAIEAIKRGAYHYLVKPFQLEELLLWVARALEERQLRAENQALRRLVSAEHPELHDMVGGSEPMRRLRDLIERVAQADAPVLIRGESGSGKELVARGLHRLGRRRQRPFVAVNCTALPEQLLDSELFGHVRGAFTGATMARRGLFMEADGGTLLLDEVGDMPAPLQAKLLRVIEDGAVRPVGSDAQRQVDVQVLASTHRDLEALVREGRFRADLFYRLNVVPVPVPPLRERRADVPELVAHFIARTRRSHPAASVKQLSEEAMALLCRCAWPGNVRELENVVRRLVIVGTSERLGADVVLAHAPSVVEAGSGLPADGDAMPPLRRVEDDYIAAVIRRCGGNKTRAAQILGIDVSTIHRRERLASAE